MDYITTNHSKHLLMTHLIFVCKYRKKLLIPYGEEMKRLLIDISYENDLDVVEMEVDKDHVHMLVRYPPTKSILQIVKLYKQVSTYRIWRQNNNHVHLRKCF